MSTAQLPLRRRWWGRLALAALVLVLVAAGSARLAVASTPSSGTVSQTAPSAAWQGKSFTIFAPAGDCSLSTPNCDVYDLTVAPGDYSSWRLSVTAKGSSSSDDYGLYVTKPDGTTSNSESSSPTVNVDAPAPGLYHVEVYAFVGVPGDTYAGTATLTQVSSDPGATDPRDVRYAFDQKAPVATLDTPLRIVLVGFNRATSTRRRSCPRSRPPSGRAC
jgi:hypothetical protein